MRGSIALVLFPSSSWRPESFKIKRLSHTHQWSVPGNQRAYWYHLHLGFNPGSHINKTGTEGSNICGAVSTSSWNDLNYWVVELMLFISRRIGSNHHWNLIWTYIPYYCFSPPRRGGAFSNPSSAHPQLVHIYENIFCKTTPLYLWNFIICLPVILVCNFHLLIILQCLCL